MDAPKPAKSYSANPAHSVKRRLIVGFAWLFASRVVINIIGFASSIVLARLLMPEDFGLVALAMSVIAVVAAVTMLPIPEALLRTPDLTNAHIDSAFTLGLLRSVGLALLLAAAAWPCADIFNDARIIPIMLVLAFNALLTGLYSPSYALIQKTLSFRPEFMMMTVSKLIGTVVALVIAFVFRSYWAIIFSTVAMQAASVIITYYYAPYRLRLSTKHIGEIWSFSLWVTLSGAINTLSWRVDYLAMGGVLGSKTLGYYSYGDNLATLLTRESSTPLVKALFPGLVAVGNDPDRLRSAYRRVQSLVFAICAPLGVGFALTSDQFVPLLLGEKWLMIVPVIQTIAVVTSLQNIGIAVQPLAMTLGNTRQMFRRDVTSFCIRVPLILAGLFLYGLPGVLAGRALAEILALLINLHLARQITGISIISQIRGCGRSIGALLIMSGAVLVFKDAIAGHHVQPVVSLIATVAVGGLAYVAGHAGLWLMANRPHGPEEEILSTLRNGLAKLSIGQVGVQGGR